MSKVERFEDLKIWQRSIDLSKSVYTMYGKLSDQGFKSQICRASVSVSNNIAEGFERGSDAEFRRFLYISKGSCGEVRSMCHLAIALEIGNKDSNEKLIIELTEVSKMISGMIKYLN